MPTSMADHADESAQNVYDSVRREFAASMLHGSCGPSSQPYPSRELRRLVSSRAGWFGRLPVCNDEIQPYRPAS
jgi:hypothetical protein